MSQRVGDHHRSVVLGCAGALVAAALVAGVLVSFRATGLVLAGGLVVLAVARVALPPRVAAPLAVRSRGVDAVVALGLAAALVVLSLTAPAPEGPAGPPAPPGFPSAP